MTQLCNQILLNPNVSRNIGDCSDSGTACGLGFAISIWGLSTSTPQGALHLDSTHKQAGRRFSHRLPAFVLILIHTFCVAWRLAAGAGVPRSHSCKARPGGVPAVARGGSGGCLPPCACREAQRHGCPLPDPAAVARPPARGGCHSAAARPIGCLPVGGRSVEPACRLRSMACLLQPRVWQLQPLVCR